MAPKFQIQRKLGKENRVADALPHCHAELEMRAISMWKYEGVKELVTEIDQDSHSRELKQKIIPGGGAQRV